MTFRFPTTTFWVDAGPGRYRGLTPRQLDCVNCRGQRTGPVLDLLQPVAGLPQLYLVHCTLPCYACLPTYQTYVGSLPVRLYRRRFSSWYSATTRSRAGHATGFSSCFAFSSPRFWHVTTNVCLAHARLNRTYDYVTLSVRQPTQPV